MHDDVVQVDQHPLGLAVALDAARLDTGFLRFHDEVVRHRLDVTHRAARGDHEHVRQWVLTAYVDVLDVDGFEVFQGAEDHVLELFEQDEATKAVVMIGEIGGPQEAEAAAYFKTEMTKPVIGYIAGLTAPKGKRMGHAGAIISAFGESAAEKVTILEESGITVVPNPNAFAETVQAVRTKHAA